MRRRRARAFLVLDAIVAIGLAAVGVALFIAMMQQVDAATDAAEAQRRIRVEVQSELARLRTRGVSEGDLAVQAPARTVGAITLQSTLARGTGEWDGFALVTVRGAAATHRQLRTFEISTYVPIGAGDR